MVRRFDAYQGVASWAEALDWLLHVHPGRAIGEIQFWGHGRWGGLRIEKELIEIDVLKPSHALHERMLALRPRMLADGSSLWWFRSCDTFGTPFGHDFAKAWTRFFACRAAGHTYTIHALQSGLYTLEAGAEPTWSETEGVVPGRSHARSSHLGAPNTITCLHGEVPASESLSRQRGL
jgi:hypothetical protein